MEPYEILREAKRLVVVGCSRTVGKAAHDVPEELMRHGWEIVPVNPNTQDEILGERVYETLSEVPGEIDLVVVFRPSQEAAGVAREAIKVKAKGIWLQLGIKSEEAKRICQEA